MATKERELHLTYNDSLAEMKGLLSAQKRVGAQWKGEMEILTKRFQVNNWLYFLQNIFVITGVAKRVLPRLRECSRQVEAEVVSNSSNNILQTWEALFWQAL